MKRARKEDDKPATTQTEGHQSKRHAPVSIILPAGSSAEPAGGGGAAAVAAQPLSVDELCLVTEGASIPIARLCRDVDGAADPVARRRIAELLGRGGTAVELGAGAATTTTVVRDDVSTLVALATADADCNVRASAVGALARLVGGGRFALGGEAVTRLQTVAAHACVDQHHYVRETALTLLVRLATLSSPRARAPAVVAVDTGSGSGRGGGEISQGSGGTVTALVMTPHRRALRMLVDIDPRVRAAALTALLELQRGAVPLDLTTYVDAQRALTDDDETVRSAALGLILSFGTRHPDGVAPPEAVSAATTTRLADNAFVTLCSAVTDLSPRIRAQASALLGDLVDVSEDTLLQTFDKKVMSHLRRKLTEHEAMRKAGSSRAGPLRAFGDLDVENMSLMSTGACGAFVHGLEDEFFEVREAAIQSICRLAARSAALAEKSLDFLADMFNDEIDSVRLLAINGLRAFAASFIFRREQVELMLGILKDGSGAIRTAMHLLIAKIRVGSVDCLRMIVGALLRNIKMYRMDHESIWAGLCESGRGNGAFAEFMVEELLKTGVHFSTAEPNADDPVYIAAVIFLANAAPANPNVLTLLPPFMPRHHRYLKGILPALVPPLDFLAASAFVGDIFLPTTVAPPPAVGAAVLGVVAGAGLQSHSAVEQGEGVPQGGAAAMVSPLDDSLQAADDALKLFARGQHARALANLEACRRRLAKLGQYATGGLRGEVRLQHDFVRWMLQYCRLAAALVQSNGVDAAQSSETALLYHLGARHMNLPPHCHSTLALCRALSHAQDVCRLMMRPGELWDAVSAALDQFVERASKILDASVATAEGAVDAECRASLERCVDAVSAALADKSSAARIKSRAGEALIMLMRCAPPRLGAASGASQPATATVLEPMHGFNALTLTLGLPQEVRVVAQLFNVNDLRSVRLLTTFPDGRRVTLVPPRHHFREVGQNRWLLESKVYVANDRLADSFEVQIAVGVTYAMDLRHDPILSGEGSTSAETRLDGATGFMQIGKAVPASLRVRKPKKPL